MPRVMLAGRFGPGALELSYESAFRALGYEVARFDLMEAVDRYCRVGWFGRSFNRFVPVEPWVKKANRELVLAAREFEPDLVVAFGPNPIRAGALAQIRASTCASLALVWPDPMQNLPEPQLACLPLYDTIATYSAATVREFEYLGGRNVRWVPFGADPAMYPAGAGIEPSNGTYAADVSFIGSWRPEREEALKALLAESGSIDVKIWGPEWGRRCRGEPAILRAWQGRSLYEAEFARAVSASKINLNIIDRTNYPAANMRFFEIPCAGGLQVSSPAPEMEAELEHGKALFYYADPRDLPEMVRDLLADDEMRRAVAGAGHRRVVESHTYADRAARILEALDLAPKASQLRPRS